MRKKDGEYGSTVNLVTNMGSTDKLAGPPDTKVREKREWKWIILLLTPLKITFIRQTLPLSLSSRLTQSRSPWRREF